jgi:hypothetical protein
VQHNGRDIEVGDAVMFTEADQAAGPVMCPGRVGMGIVQSVDTSNPVETLYIIIPALDFHGSNTGYVDDPANVLEHWPAAPAA